MRSTTSTRTQRRTCAKDELRALLVENESRRHNDEIQRQTQLTELNNRAVAVQEAILEEHKNTNALLALFENEHKKTIALMERAVTAFEKYVEKLYSYDVIHYVLIWYGICFIKFVNRQNYILSFCPIRATQQTGHFWTRLLK